MKRPRMKQPPLIEDAPPGPDAKPFLKWAGGKAWQMPAALPLIPKAIGTYWSPFLGGGADFFAVRAEELRGLRSVQRYVLSDTNADLVNAFVAVRDFTESLIEDLGRCTYSKGEYYGWRRARPDSEIERAVRFIYLNRTCFNGLYRENARGEFNVPMGKYKNPRICDADGLRAACRALQGVEILVAPWERAIDRARAGDFVYLDPPYLPAGRGKDSFAAYQRAGFTKDDHVRLAGAVWSLTRRQILCLLSNVDTPEARALYKGLPQRHLVATRSVGAKARAPQKELLARNWKGDRMVRAPETVAEQAAMTRSA